MPLTAQGGLLKQSPKDKAKPYLSSVIEAEVIYVHEDLPHQSWESDLLKEELKRKDTTKIWKYPFYTPKTKAHDIKDLQKVLGDLNIIKVYRGPKRCGGYHPDYCISWQKESSTFYALVCYGCGEIVFYDSKSFIIYDIEDEALRGLKDLLQGYQKKRPKKDKSDPRQLR